MERLTENTGEPSIQYMSKPRCHYDSCMEDCANESNCHVCVIQQGFDNLGECKRISEALMRMDLPEDMQNEET